MAEPILDIATLVERPVVAIDGERYEILSPDELSVLDHARLAAQGRRLDALMAAADPGAADGGEMTRLLDAIAARVMVGVPEAVRAKLSDSHKLAVLEVFTRLPLARGLMAALAGAATGRTGARPSPASSASTAAGRGGGSRKRPSPSSAR